MSRISINPLLEDSSGFTIIAPKRVVRPFQEKSSEQKCPFCQGSEEVPHKLDTVISLPNKFPSLTINAVDPESSPYEKAAKGICEVILYSSNHDKAIYDQPNSFIEDIIKHWIERYNEVTSNLDDVQYVFIFENYGKEIGVSLEHPHGQLYGLPIVPDPIMHKLRGFQSKVIECIYCTNNQLVAINNQTEFTISVPKFAKWPFELHIYPKRHISKINELSPKEIVDLAVSIKKSMLMLMDKYDKKVPYIFSLQQTFVKDTSGDFHLHFELISPQITKNRLKYRAGVETVLGVFINSIDPDVLAKELVDSMK